MRPTKNPVLRRGKKLARELSSWTPAVPFKVSKTLPPRTTMRKRLQRKLSEHVTWGDESTDESDESPSVSESPPSQAFQLIESIANDYDSSPRDEHPLQKAIESPPNQASQSVESGLRRSPRTKRPSEKARQHDTINVFKQEKVSPIVAGRTSPNTIKVIDPSTKPLQPLPVPKKATSTHLSTKPLVSRGRGRPKGSKKKPTTVVSPNPKRHGRPRGSKNKVIKIQNEFPHPKETKGSETLASHRARRTQSRIASLKEVRESLKSNRTDGILGQDTMAPVANLTTEQCIFSDSSDCFDNDIREGVAERSFEETLPQLNSNEHASINTVEALLHSRSWRKKDVITSPTEEFSSMEGTIFEPFGGVKQLKDIEQLQDVKELKVIEPLGSIQPIGDVEHAEPEVIVEQAIKEEQFDDNILQRVTDIFHGHPPVYTCEDEIPGMRFETPPPYIPIGLRQQGYTL